MSYFSKNNAPLCKENGMSEGSMKRQHRASVAEPWFFITGRLCERTQGAQTSSAQRKHCASRHLGIATDFTFF
uniref:Uncharacterized protein n=1 Tax=Syphacia muris TaxID=451379 RepID=A0A0N5A8N9_9BILA